MAQAALRRAGTLARPVGMNHALDSFTVAFASELRVAESPLACKAKGTQSQEALTGTPFPVYWRALSPCTAANGYREVSLYCGA